MVAVERFHGNRTHLRAILSKAPQAVVQLSDDAWHNLADVVGVNEPSVETRDTVIAIVTNTAQAMRDVI